jgi:tRNA (mo5U34)-methyltransferase
LTNLDGLSDKRAADLAARTDIIWHQRFELAPGVFTGGVSDVAFLLELASVPQRLDGATVLDIGTTNGGAAFECERRGAKRVVAVDIADPDWFGFAAIREALGSRVEHLQGSIYELPELLNEQFDIVLFWGVLYHLRHPLLALDNLRRLTRGTASIETAVCDHELERHQDLPLVRFYRTDELAGDSSNWFAPTVVALGDWCRSCGLDPTRVAAWPELAPSRAMVVESAVAGEPEYARISYERRLSCTVAGHGAEFGR